MIKKGAQVTIILLFLSLAFVSSLNVNVTNISIIPNYSVGDKISGQFILNASNVYPDSYLTSSLGHSILFRDFLKNNSKDLDCSLFDCKDKWTSNSSAFTSASFNIGPSNSKLLGVRVDGNTVILRDIDMYAQLNFAQQNTIPLKISFGESGNWSFLNESTTFTRHFSIGASNLSSSDFNKVIISTPYCQKLDFVATKRVLLGANFTGTSTSSLYMDLRSSQNAIIGECNFSAQNHDSCMINLTQELSAGDYFVCIDSGSLSNSGLNLGYKASSNPKGYFGSVYSLSAGDYSLWAKTPTYSSSNSIVSLISEDSKTNILNHMRNYLFSYYKATSSNSIDCSSGCFIPIKFEGVEQTVGLINFSLSYEGGSGQTTTNQVYNLSNIPSIGNVYGSFNLDKADFKVNFSGVKNVSFFIARGSDKTKLFNTTLSSASISTVIRSVYPLVIPAGVQTEIFADVLSNVPVISYTWIFGDDRSSTTTKSSVSKIYENITQYNLTLQVTNNLSQITKRSFLVDVVNPNNYLNTTLNKSTQDLAKVTAELNSLSIPFKDKVKLALKLDELHSELTSLDIERETATTESQFVDIALRIRNLEIPQRVWIESKQEDIFIVDPTKIDLTTINTLSGETLSDTGYKDYISNWQIANVLGGMEVIRLAVIDNLGVQKSLATIYRLDILSNDKAYLIVQNATGVESSIPMQQTGDSKTLELVPGQEKTLDLISFNSTELVIYVSPEPSTMDLVQSISVCNSNLVCEKKLGEDYKNCRSDCRPWPTAIALLLIILILAIITYTFVQIQFKKKYEIYLFGSEQELKNLIESIHNSTENKVSEKDITDRLIKNGWSKEQVKYAIQKSKGERTRPYELIPMDKFLSKFDSKKDVNKKGIQNELHKKAEK